MLSTTRTNAFNSFSNTSNGHYKVNFSNGFTHSFEIIIWLGLLTLKCFLGSLASAFPKFSIKSVNFLFVKQNDLYFQMGDCVDCLDRFVVQCHSPKKTNRRKR